MLRCTQVALLLLCATPVIADPLDNWHWRNPLPQGNNLSAITFGQGKFLAVGDAGVVVTSTDGLTWAAADQNSSYQLAVTYGNGTFVSVGGLGGRMASSNGVDWAITPAGDGTDWTGVSAGPNLFVAFRLFGATPMLTSPDGLTWTPGPATPNPGDVRAVTYGNGLFVAVGSSGSVFTSTNGTSWALTNIAANAYGVTYCGGFFTAVGTLTNKTAIFTSTDAKTWTTAVYNSANVLRSVTYGNGMWVATGDALVLTSTDHLNWYSQPTGLTNSLRSMGLLRIDGERIGRIMNRQTHESSNSQDPS